MVGALKWVAIISIIKQMVISLFQMVPICIEDFEKWVVVVVVELLGYEWRGYNDELEFISTV